MDGWSTQMNIPHHASLDQPIWSYCTLFHVRSSFNTLSHLILQHLCCHILKISVVFLVFPSHSLLFYATPMRFCIPLCLLIHLIFLFFIAPHSLFSFHLIHVHYLLWVAEIPASHLSCRTPCAYVLLIHPRFKWKWKIPADLKIPNSRDIVPFMIGYWSAN